MQEPEDKIHDATHPLCGFEGRQIVALGKITIPVTFTFVHNTRTEQVVFDICNAPNFAVEFFLFFTRQNSGVTFSFSLSPR
jgi:glucose uptake protein GlcU